jgi:hypothetical protein
MGVDLVLGIEIWNPETETWDYQTDFEWIGERCYEAFRVLVGDAFLTRKIPEDVTNLPPVTFSKHCNIPGKEDILWACGTIVVSELVYWIITTPINPEEDEDDIYGNYNLSTKYNFKLTILWPCTRYLFDKEIPQNKARICFGFY